MATKNPTANGTTQNTTDPLTSGTTAQLVAMLSKLTELADAIQAQADAIIAGADNTGLVVGIQALAGQAGWIADSAQQLLGEKGFKVTATEWMLPEAVVAQD